MKSDAAYSINDDEVTCVRLTDDGKKLLNQIYFGRPHYEYAEGDLYYFKCSSDQLYLYFRRFYTGAEVISPISLRKRIIDFHNKALSCYKEEEKDNEI